MKQIGNRFACKPGGYRNSHQWKMVSSMGTTDKKQEKNHKKNYRKICAIAGGICIIAMIVAGVSVIVAKYYAYQSAPGISVASAFYFNSNRLAKSLGPATKDAVQAMDTTGVPVTVNEAKWISGSCQFPIEIRNYDSNLLYNEAGLTTKYEIYFRLIGTPHEATYHVSKKENGQADETTELTTAKPMVKYTSVLSGGSLKSEEYQISITLTGNADDYEKSEKAKVLVVAYPTSPDYLRNDTAQPFRLVGMFEGHITEGEMEIESDDFLVQSSTDYNDTTWKDKVNDLSGLIFNVKTKGDMAASDSNAAKHEAFVKWNSDYLQISEYDENYQYAEKKEADAGTTNEWLFEKTETDGTWKYMKIEALPYTSVDITFYKTEKFIQEMNNDTMTKEEFEGLASASMEDETRSQ